MPLAAICHDPWIFIDAEVAEDRRLTSYAAFKNDLKKAGALWNDLAVVVDNGLVTSRTPEDLPEFNKKMLKDKALSLVMVVGWLRFQLWGS
jgi:protease I